VSAVTAIGSASALMPQTAASKPALRAQLSRYEKERTDCVNCPSAKTTEGKQNIQKLDTAIKKLEEQLGAVRQADVNGVRSQAQDLTAKSTVGRVDVFA
jgi:hypothetical protein